MAIPRSFTNSPKAKVLGKARVRTLWGMRFSVALERPEEALMTSRGLLRGNPLLHQGQKPLPRRPEVHGEEGVVDGLHRMPRPHGAHVDHLLGVGEKGPDPLHRLLGPPSITVRVPASAPEVPPETGASR